MNNKQKGFTLIELLVVIAIIGILASLVLVALGNARAKANDARIKSNISQLRTLAEVIYDSKNSSYVTVDDCFTGTADATNCGNSTIAANVTTMRADFDSQGTTLVSAGATAQTFCVSALLKSDPTISFCADSSGVTRSSASAVCGGGVCPP